MNNQYLMPANTKKAILFLGFMNTRDIWIFAISALITLILALILQNPNLVESIVAFTPLGIGVLLILPIPHYHNVCQYILNVIYFILGVKKYYWRGWCVKDGEDDNE